MKKQNSLIPFLIQMNQSTAGHKNYVSKKKKNLNLCYSNFKRVLINKIYF